MYMYMQYLLIVQNHLEMAKQTHFLGSTLNILSVLFFSVKTEVHKIPILVQEDACSCFIGLKNHDFTIN